METIRQHLQPIIGRHQGLEAQVVLAVTHDLRVTDLVRYPGNKIRSNHLGNDYPSNQAFIEYGDGVLVQYDRTTTVDANYRPWELRKGRERVEIARPPYGQLTPYFTPNRAFYEALGSLPEPLQQVKTPAQLHYASQRLLHPRTVTFSQWLLDHQGPVKDLADILGVSMPLFSRQVNADGTLRPPDYQAAFPNAGEKVIEAAEQLRDAVIFGDNRPAKDILLQSNEFNVYVSLALEAMKPDNQLEFDGRCWGVVFHGSGPDMVKYVKGYQATLAAMHQEVIRRGFPIPKSLYLGIVPTADLKMAVTQKHRHSVDQVMEAIRELQGIKKLAISGDQRALARLEATDRSLEELFTTSKVGDIDLKAPFSVHGSHYDIFDEGRIYMPDDLVSAPFNRIRDINNRIAQIRNRLCPKPK